MSSLISYEFKNVSTPTFNYYQQFKFSMIKAVLFDLDNTLVDFLKVKTMAIENAVSAMIDAGLKVPKNRILKTLDRIYREKGIEYQHIFDDLLEELEGKINPKILASGIVAYRRVKIAHIDPYPGVVPALIELKRRGYRIGIISDAPRLQVWTRLCEMRLQHLFDPVICFEDSGEKKPSSLPFKAAVGKLRLKPDEILMVGDMIERDILGAQKLGIKTVLAKYGAGASKGVGLLPRKVPRGIMPNYTIKSFDEILKILK